MDGERRISKESGKGGKKVTSPLNVEIENEIACHEHYFLLTFPVTHVGGLSTDCSGTRVFMDSKKTGSGRLAGNRRTTTFVFA